jgi:hypothetical protein
MKLLDLLQQYPGWTLDADGQLWEVGAYIRQFEAYSQPGDRGPEVIAEPSIDLVAVAVMELDAFGTPQRKIGLLYQQGRRL